MNQDYSILPDKNYCREWIRPWKLVSFTVAMGWLLYGALNYGIGDWDVGITIIMGGLTYLLAPWSVNTILIALRARPKFWYLHVTVALLVSLWVIDGVYMLYHTSMENPIYREANLYASTPIYFLAGMVWLYQGSLRALLAEIKSLVRPRQDV